MTGGAGGMPMTGGSSGAGAGGLGGAPPAVGGSAGIATTGGTSGMPAVGGAGGTAGATAGAGGTGGDAGGSAGSVSAGTAGLGGANSGGATGASGAAAGGAGTGGQAPMTEYWVSPSGSDSNTGTEALPFKTINRAQNPAEPGATIWLMAGTHAINAKQSLVKAGTQAMPFKVWAVAGARPVLDFATQPRDDGNQGIEITGNYWHVRGLDVRNAGDNGILISGSYNTIEDVIAHGNEDTGIQITVRGGNAGDAAYGSYNKVLNCDSYENFDEATGGENADGFAAKERIGPGNEFRGCRAWNNADDGWDFYAANDAVVVDNCWAFLNGELAGANPQGDGNGFKLGGEPAGDDQGGAVHRLTNVNAFDNVNCGFTRNNNPSTPTLATCGVANNDGEDYCEVNCSPTRTVSTSGSSAKSIARADDGSLPNLP